MKVKYTLVCIAISALVSAATYYIVGQQDQKGIAVIDAVKLFNSYNLKVELENEAKVKLSFYGKKIDSLTTLLQAADSKNIQDEKLISRYQNVKRALDREYEQSNQAINETVWIRLNPLIDEFGQKKGLHLIIGANGMGSVLYQDNVYDITQEVIEYINNRYESGT